MEQISMEKDELYKLVKQAVREVVREELFQIRLQNLPEVSQEEMDDIERTYGNPPSEKAMELSETVKV